jgi:hypothetical protein
MSWSEWMRACSNNSHIMSAHMTIIIFLAYKCIAFLYRLCSTEVALICSRLQRHYEQMSAMSILISMLTLRFSSFCKMHAWRRVVRQREKARLVAIENRAKLQID